MSSVGTRALFARSPDGKPLIPLSDPSVYAFGSLIRATEAALLQLFSQGLLSGTTHTAIGQELCQMAVVRALDDPHDVVLSNHRNHGHFLTYSGQFRALLEEILGRQGGVCRGIGGSQHLAYRNFHSNGVQAGMTGVAVGQALAAKLFNRSGIVASVVGDGTLGEGMLYESMNLSSIWQLPVLFVVENNGIAQTTPTALTIGGTIDARGSAFGLRVWRLNDADRDFLAQAEVIVKSVRESCRPGFLIIDTMRLGPHSKGDDLRDATEMAAIRQRDPLARIGDRLSQGERAEIDAAVKEYIAETTEAAKQSPESHFERPLATIFKEHVPSPTNPNVPREGNVRANLNASLRQLLTQVPEVILLGEDMHDPYGGAFKVTSGLSTDFPERVLSTPISEAGVIGTGIGLALAGARPIVEIMFADFLTLGMDQIFNHAVKFPGMFPDAQVPLVIRTPSGGRRGYGPTHSQSTESLMTAVPGLTVVFGSQRHAVGELLWRAVMDWPYPTIFFEHKLLYAISAEPGDYRELTPSLNDPAAPLFPTLVSGPEDPDITLVCYGGMVSWAEKLAGLLSEEELQVEIVVPSLLSPLPKTTLLSALHKRERIAVLEEGYADSGFGTVLGAALLEAGYSGKFVRVATPPIPIPAARSLEAEIIPDEKNLLKRIMILFQP
jgi:2-oxoisovalerate dehydrogenase E1 component